jgi:glycosyltransferase involved in cell wall biosynthesis
MLAIMADERPCVVYLCEHPTLLGGERSLLTFLTAVRDVVRPIVVCPAQGPLGDALEKCGIERLSLDDGLASKLIERKPTLLHSNSLSMTWVTAILAEELGRPWVAHVRDIYSLSRRRWRILSGASAVVAVSPAVAEFLLAGGVPIERIHMVVNAVDVAGAAGQGSREALGLPPGRLVACVGQISLRKGQDVFVRAAMMAAEKLPEARFLIVGERYSSKDESLSFERSLRSLAGGSGSANRFHFLGERRDVRDILEHVTTLVVPSRQEPLSRVLLEGLAAGCLVVATDVGGNGFILEDGGLGRLVPVDDPGALADAIVASVAEDREIGASIRREAIARRFSPKKQRQAMLAIYRSL